MLHTDVIKQFEIPQKWSYRGEGNSNIVISLHESNKILRIRKTERVKSILLWIINLIRDVLYWYCGKGFRDEIRDIKFYTTIMRPLIGYEYTSKAQQVLLSPKQVKILEERLSKSRPEFRKHKRLQYGRAALFEDFTHLNTDIYNYLQYSQDTYSVEIKPKQGYSAANDRFNDKCIFCLNQYKKLEKKQIVNISRYCPENLFSGDGDKMMFAIKSLIEEPQNNLRIFKNGNLVYGDKMNTNISKVLTDMFQQNTVSNESLLQEFSYFIHKCLTQNLTSNELQLIQTDHICKKVLKTNLPHGCVLERILSVQMLDEYGCNAYNNLYMNKRNSDIDEWCFVEKLLREIEINNKQLECLRCFLTMLGRNWDCNEIECDTDLVVAPYLLSAIAKDCSLMITFRKITEILESESSSSILSSSNNIFNTKFGDYLVNIGVFDLYPKPMSTIRKHTKRNLEVYEAYKRTAKLE